jgi:sugar fermentation stimulation protein A
MKLPVPLYKAKLIKRYKRFLADVEMENGEIITVHCANSGSMMGLKDEGSTVYLSYHDNPKRKLKYSWEMIDVGTSLVGINTARPNHIVEEAIAAGKIPELTGYDTIKREVKYGKNSRIDILLGKQDAPLCYVEVKSVTLSRTKKFAEFPDSVTARGAKHLQELSDMVKQGHRAVMLYLVQRSDCTRFQIADDIDPTYAQELKSALAIGVEALTYTCKLDQTEITLNPKKPIKLKI